MRGLKLNHVGKNGPHAVEGGSITGTKQRYLGIPFTPGVTVVHIRANCNHTNQTLVTVRITLYADSLVSDVEAMAYLPN